MSSFFRAWVEPETRYGLTETGGIFQVQPDGEVKPETVGRALPGTRWEISKDQEVMLQSDSNFAGLRNDEESTGSSRERLASDRGCRILDKDAHLVIIGRKEDIIRAKEGKAFSPDFIETRLKFSLYIKETIIFGEGRPFITALINIDLGNVGNWRGPHDPVYHLHGPLRQPEVEQLILEEVKRVNEQLPVPMKIKRFILLYKLLDADDED